MKVKLALATLTPDQLVDLANRIKTAMTGNPRFVTPNPTLVAFGALITALLNAIAAYETALATADSCLIQRDAAVTALRAALTQLAAYVENITGGDPVGIASAAIEVRAEAAPVGPMPRVMNLHLTIGDHSGEVDAAWDAIKRGVRIYEVQRSPDPMSESGWVPVDMSAKSSFTLTGLASGSKVWVRVRARGTEQQPGEWSDPAMIVVP